MMAVESATGKIHVHSDDQRPQQVWPTREIRIRSWLREAGCGGVRKDSRL